MIYTRSNQRSQTFAENSAANWRKDLIQPLSPNGKESIGYLAAIKHRLNGWLIGNEKDEL